MTASIPLRELFGLRFLDAPTVDAAVETILRDGPEDAAPPGRLPLVVTPNVDLLVHLHRQDRPEVCSTIRRAAFQLADGQPVVWASRLLGRPLQTRLPGSTVVAQMWPRIIRERRSVLVVASSEELADHIQNDYPKARVVVPPMLEAGDRAGIARTADDCFEACAGDPPEIVFVGLSYPKQYLLLDELIRRWPGEVVPRRYLAIGASFEMYFGIRRRAPELVQRLGLEWFFRFALEPRRLFRRYFIDDAAFVRIVWDEWRAGRAGGADPARHGISDIFPRPRGR